MQLDQIVKACSVEVIIAPMQETHIFCPRGSLKKFHTCIYKYIYVFKCNCNAIEKAPNAKAGGRCNNASNCH